MRVRWAWGIIITIFASYIEAGSKIMNKFFKFTVIALVAITAFSATPADAHCSKGYSNGRLVCSYAHHRGVSSSSRSRYYRGSYRSDGNGYGGSMMVIGSNGGDSAVNQRCKGVLWGLLWFDCGTEAVANDGYHDKPQGQVIHGEVEKVYSRTDVSESQRPSPTATPTTYTPQAPVDGDSSCATLERSCAGLDGCKAIVEDCYARGR